MKKIIYTFVIIALLSTKFLFAQEPISKVADISIPKNNEKISTKDAKLFDKQHFKRSWITEDAKNVYKIGDIPVSIWDLNESKSLQQIKLDLEGIIVNRELGQDNIIDESKITAVNNIQFYFIKYHKDDEYYYLFYSESRNSKSINGAVQFKKEQKVNADQIFDELIKSISFKK